MRKIVNERDNDGYTPLITAISSENEKMVELLLQNGADPNLKCRMNEESLPGFDEGAIKKAWFSPLKFSRLWMVYYEGELEKSRPSDGESASIYVLKSQLARGYESHYLTHKRIVDLLKKYGAK
jgi:hypothetical protein